VYETPNHRKGGRRKTNRYRVTTAGRAYAEGKSKAPEVVVEKSPVQDLKTQQAEAQTRLELVSGEVTSLQGEIAKLEATLAKKKEVLTQTQARKSELETLVQEIQARRNTERQNALARIEAMEQALQELRILVGD
jgi:chromosome segregation ATPase